MACSNAAAELVYFAGFGAVATASNISVSVPLEPASVSASVSAAEYADELLDIDPPAVPPAASVGLFGIAGAAKVEVVVDFDSTAFVALSFSLKVRGNSYGERIQ